MGGVDKGLQNYLGMPLAQHALQRLAPQVGKLMINANRNLSAYESMGVPVWPDDLIVAVESGIVVIRPNEAESVLAKAQERSRKEAILLKELQAGRTTMELLGLSDPFSG